MSGPIRACALALVAAAGLLLAACDHSSGSGRAARAASSSAAASASVAAEVADKQARSYLTAVRGWAARQPAAVRGLDFTTYMNLTAHETPKQSKGEQAACARATHALASLEPVPVLAPGTSTSAAAAAARRVSTAVTAQLTALRGDLRQYVGFCTRYDKGVALGAKATAAYRAWTKKYNYKGTLVIGTRVWNCHDPKHGNTCLRPDTSEYAASAAAYERYERYEIASDHQLDLGPLFAGPGWAAVWDATRRSDAVYQHLDTMYAAAIRYYQGKPESEAEATGNRINKAVAASDKGGSAAYRTMIAAVKAAHVAPAAALSAYAKAHPDGVLTYAQRYQMSRLQSSIRSAATRLRAAAG